MLYKRNGEIMGERKYKLLKNDTTTSFKGETLYRIKALKDFGKVKKGEKGGYIESELNLSHYGTAWVAKEAQVWGNASLSSSAFVTDKARVYGNAAISGKARVYENADVSGGAWVTGKSKVHGNAVLYGTTIVMDYAEVGGKAIVYENAIINGHAKVYDEAVVGGDTDVCSRARICGNAWVSLRGIVTTDIDCPIPKIELVSKKKLNSFIKDMNKYKRTSVFNF
jgi:UDP-3-O-[3-hydroxymyristoyl] glucosamine N-acyltransferase